jgi:hypothetical protein
LIKSFRDRDTECLWNEEPARNIPMNLRSPALRKLQMLNAASSLEDLRTRPAIGWRGCTAIAGVSTAFESTIATESALNGEMALPTVLRSSIITEGVWE